MEKDFIYSSIFFSDHLASAVGVGTTAVYSYRNVQNIPFHSIHGGERIGSDICKCLELIYLFRLTMCIRIIYFIQEISQWRNQVGTAYCDSICSSNGKGTGQSLMCSTERYVGAIDRMVENSNEDVPEFSPHTVTFSFLKSRIKFQKLKGHSITC